MSDDPTAMIALLQQVQATLNKKADMQKEAENADEWYLGFEKWFKDEFRIPELKNKYMVVWDDNEQTWFRYNPRLGIYEEQTNTQMVNLMLCWADPARIKTSEGRINHGLRRLQTIVMIHDGWDSPEFLNCLNGIYLIKEKQLVEHSPAFLTRFQLGVRFLGKPQKTPTWDKIKATYPTQINHFERFTLAALYQDYSNEGIYFGVGPTGSGKGTVAQMIQLIFGTGITFVNIEELDNDSFGLVPLLGKRICLNREGTIGYLSGRVVRFLKDVVTHEGPIDVNIKNKNRINYVFNMWFFIFSNGLYHLPEGTDRKAWFRRTIIDEYNLTQKKDIEFKANVKKEADGIFTNMLLMDYAPIIDSGTDIDAFVDANAKVWDYWADPVKRIILAIFGHCNKPEMIEISIVYDVVSKKLTEAGVYMKSDRLKAAITMYLERIGVKKYGRSNYKYIQCIDSEIAADIEEQKQIAEAEKVW